jgi:hypothetical protein
MKPCDCKDVVDVDKLQVQGVSFNDDSLEVVPGCVYITIGPARLRIAQRRFRQFAEWFLEDQQEKTGAGLKDY